MGYLGDFRLKPVPTRSRLIILTGLFVNIESASYNLPLWPCGGEENEVGIAEMSMMSLGIGGGSGVMGWLEAAMETGSGSALEMMVASC